MKKERKGKNKDIKISEHKDGNSEQKWRDALHSSCRP